MREIVSTVTNKGQVTIPAHVRNQLGIERGGKISFVIADDGTVHLRATKYPTIASVAGAAGTLPEPLSWDRVEEIAGEDSLAEKSRK